MLPWLFLFVSSLGASQSFAVSERRSVSWDVWQRSELYTSSAVLSEVNLGGPRSEPSLHVVTSRRSLPLSLKRWLCGVPLRALACLQNAFLQVASRLRQTDSSEASQRRVVASQITKGDLMPELQFLFNQ